MSIVTLSRDDACVKIVPFGAHVVSWVHKGKERLFMSKKAVMDGSKAIRGGIPLVFPQFGRPNEALPSHGIARISKWNVVATTPRKHSVSFTLSSEDVDEIYRKEFGYAFKLTYTVALEKDGALCVNLKVYNGSKVPMDCQFLIHSYFRCHALSAQVRGFSGSRYVDKLTIEDDALVEKKDVLTIKEEVDRVYQSLLSETIEIRDDEHRRIRITNSASTGKRSIPCDVVFWNPWIAKSKRLSDLNDEGYKDFVCVEPGLVSRVHTVEPEAEFVLTQVIRCDDEGDVDADEACDASKI